MNSNKQRRVGFGRGKSKRGGGGRGIIGTRRNNNNNGPAAAPATAGQSGRGRGGAAGGGILRKSSLARTGAVDNDEEARRRRQQQQNEDEEGQQHEQNQQQHQDQQDQRQQALSAENDPEMPGRRFSESIEDSEEFTFGSLSSASITDWYRIQEEIIAEDERKRGGANPVSSLVGSIVAGRGEGKSSGEGGGGRRNQPQKNAGSGGGGGGGGLLGIRILSKKSHAADAAAPSNVENGTTEIKPAQDADSYDDNDWLATEKARMQYQRIISFAAESSDTFSSGPDDGRLTEEIKAKLRERGLFRADMDVSDASESFYTVNDDRSYQESRRLAMLPTAADIDAACFHADVMESGGIVEAVTSTTARPEFIPGAGRSTPANARAVQPGRAGASGGEEKDGDDDHRRTKRWGDDCCGLYRPRSPRRICMVVSLVLCLFFFSLAMLGITLTILIGEQQDQDDPSTDVADGGNTDLVTSAMTAQEGGGTDTTVEDNSGNNGGDGNSSSANNSHVQASDGNTTSSSASSSSSPGETSGESTAQEGKSGGRRREDDVIDDNRNATDLPNILGP